MGSLPDRLARLGKSVRATAGVLPATEPPLTLALLRIAIGVVVLLSPETGVARIVAARDAVSWVHPEGLGWLGGWVPLTPAAAAVAGRVLQAAACLVIAGLFTRVSLAILAATILYVFGAAQLTGTVTHDMHLFWFAVLLAMVPRGSGPGDALSLDRLRSGENLAGPGPNVASSLAVLASRLWLGFVYFFPGLWKVIEGGRAWVSGEILRGQLHFKWYEAGGVVPWPRLDQVPGALGVVAVAVLVFELAMPLLVAARQTRPVALACGLAFHLGAGHFLDVLFPSLMACYVVLLPGARLRGSQAAPSVPARTHSWLLLVAASITAAILVQGARGQTQAWPFACYPTFATRAPDEITDLAVDLEVGGGLATFRLPRLRRQDEWGMVWRVAGLYGDPIDPARLDAFARLVVPRELLQAPRTFVLESYDVRPEAYGAPPLRRRAALE